MMPLYILSSTERDFYKESYIRRLYKDGYPATTELMRKFNKKFYDDHGLQGEKRAAVSKVLRRFCMNLGKIKTPRALSRKPELMKLLSAVTADYQQKRGVDDDQEDDSDDDVDIEHVQLAEDDENNDWEEEEEAENEGAIAILENRNEELAKTLKMKDEECQQLEEENRTLKEALQKKSKEQSQQKKSTVARLEAEKRSLEEKNRLLEEVLQKEAEEQAELSKKSDTANLQDEKRALEEKIRSLKAALHKKDQMLETALQIQHNLSTLVNKPAPQ